MNRWARNLGLVLTPALILSVALLGCSGDKEKGKTTKSKEKTEDEEVAGKLKAIKTGSGVLTGKVTLKEGVDLTSDIETITASLKKQIADNKNKDVCEQASKQKTWLVDKDSRGVKNVFVWIKPENEDEQFFDVKELAEKQKGFKPILVLDQPHCAFDPRALVLFPAYIDPGKASKGEIVRTKQKLYVINPYGIEHNTKWEVRTEAGKSGNLVVPKSTQQDPQAGLDMTDLGRFKGSYKEPVEIHCNIHPWMTAYAWAFPHPYAAVTNDKGEYTIENLPTGVKVRVVAWHEGPRWINGGGDGEVIDLSEKNTKNFEITRTKPGE